MKNKTLNAELPTNRHVSRISAKFQLNYFTKNYESGTAKEVTKRQEKILFSAGVLSAAVFLLFGRGSIEGGIGVDVFLSVCIGITVSLISAALLSLSYLIAANMKAKRDKNTNFLLAVEEVLHTENAKTVLKVAKEDQLLQNWLQNLLNTEGMEIITGLADDSDMTFKDALELTLALKSSENK